VRPRLAIDALRMQMPAAELPAASSYRGLAHGKTNETPNMDYKPLPRSRCIRSFFVLLTSVLFLSVVLCVRTVLLRFSSPRVP